MGFEAGTQFTTWTSECAPWKRSPYRQYAGLDVLLGRLIRQKVRVSFGRPGELKEQFFVLRVEVGRGTRLVEESAQIAIVKRRFQISGPERITIKGNPLPLPLATKRQVFLFGRMVGNSHNAGR